VSDTTSAPTTPYARYKETVIILREIIEMVAPSARRQMVTQLKRLAGLLALENVTAILNQLDQDYP
jgi:hypothetical protein